MSLYFGPVLDVDAGILEGGVVVLDVGVLVLEVLMMLREVGVALEVGVVLASWVSTLVGIQGGAKVSSLLTCLSLVSLLSEA